MIFNVHNVKQVIAQAMHKLNPVFICLLFFGGVLFWPGNCQAAFNEQMAISTEAISLGNAVTAAPPGLMSIHYNPAGLSLLPDGKWFSQGVSIPVLVKTSKFTKDGDYEGILGGFNNDPIVAPTGHYEGTNTSGRMYLPVLDTTLDFLIAPTMGLSYRKPGSRWTFAVGNYAPFAVGLVHGDPNDPTKYGGRAAYQQHLIYAAPAVSYRITDSLSVGLTVGFGQTAMGAEMDMRSPNDMVALTRTLANATESLEIPVLSELTLPPPWFGGGVSPYDRVGTMKLALRDDFTPNYNLGLLWEPVDWFSFGICYQSPIKVELNGYYSLEYSDVWQQMVDWLGSTPLLVTTSGMFDLPTNPVPSQQGTMTTKIEFPQRVQFGVKLGPFKKLTLQFDVKWANWSVLKRDKFVFDQDIQLLRLVKMLGYTYGNRTMILKRNFRDTWDWGIGLKYQLLDNLELRMGYEWRKTPVRHELFDLMYALPSLHCFGGGVGITLPNKMQVDLAFEYIVNKGFSVANDSSTNLNSVDFTDVVYNPYAGLDYEQDTETYMGSLNVSMPFEVMQHMMHEQMAMVQKIINLLNPFAKKQAHKAGSGSGKQGKVRSDQGEAFAGEKGVEDLVVKLPASYLPKQVEISATSKKQVLAWLRKWQLVRVAADQARLRAFYSPLTIVQGHFGRKAALGFLQSQNFALGLWREDNIRISLHPRGVKVVLPEDYFDALQGGLVRRKVTLVLERHGDSFRVLSEHWERLRKEMSAHDVNRTLLARYQEWQKGILARDYSALAGMYAHYALLDGGHFGARAVVSAQRSWLGAESEVRFLGQPQFSRHPRGMKCVVQVQFGNLLGPVRKWQIEQVWSLIPGGKAPVKDNSAGLGFENQGLQWKIVSERHCFLDGQSLGVNENKSVREFLQTWLDQFIALDLEHLKGCYLPYVLAGSKLGRQAAVSTLQDLWVKYGDQIKLERLKIKDHPRGKEVTFILHFNGFTSVPVRMVLQGQSGHWQICSQAVLE